MNPQLIKNKTVKAYEFLDEMYGDSYFPAFLVDKIKDILIELCLQIEKISPKNLFELYQLTHAATENINALAEVFWEHGSEIETAATECIAEDFEFISKAYGFEADWEDLTATRRWK